MRLTFECHRLLFAYCAIALALTLGCPCMQAQITSVSPGIGDPLSGSLSDQSQTDGFNTSFDSSTSNLTNATVHSDISDPTHASLLGSALTPFDNAYASASVDTAPQSGVLTDAQAAVGASGGSFGGGRSNQIFTSRGFTAQSMSGRANALSSLGLGSMRAAFGGAASGRAMFSGAESGSAGKALSFSGEGVPAPQTQIGVGATQTTLQLNQSDRVEGFYATDPVLSGSTTGYEADLQLYGDLPLPSTQTGVFFADSSNIAVPQYQFDDGQTPLQYARYPAAGQVIGGPPDYGVSPYGFPDSTRGLAGLNSEAANAISPLEKPAGSTSLALASSDEGLTFSPTFHLIPSLRAVPTPHEAFRFEAVERREQELRILNGMTISQASEAYKQDVRKYRRQLGRALPQRPAADISTTSNQRELMGSPTIR